MTLLALALSAVLAQAEVQPAEPLSPAERAAASAERAALAAEKAAAAAQRVAEAIAGPLPVPVLPGAPVVPAGEPAPEHWKGLVGVSLIALSGNAETITGSVNAQADRKLGDWAFGARFNGAYGQTTPPEGGDAQVSALRAALTGRVDRKIASFATLFAQAGVDTDHVKSIELRGFGELGSGITFVERKEGEKEAEFEKMLLRVDLAFRASYETRYQYIATATVPAGTPLPSVAQIGPRLAVAFRYALNKDVRFSQEAEFLPNLFGASRYLVNSTTRLAARLTGALSLSVGFTINVDTAPSGGKKSTDTALTLGVEASF